MDNTKKIIKYTDSLKTWSDVEFNNILNKNNIKKHRIIGMTFPEQNTSLGLEPSVLTVLPDGDNVEYSLHNINFNNDDVDYYVCAVYISGYDEFKEWAAHHDKTKIIVGGYQPTTFPEDFLNYADKVIVGTCDDFFATIKQDGKVVKGITNHKKIPRYDLYDSSYNQQIIPDKLPNELAISINTSCGCPFKCDFCCSPLMAAKIESKPLDLIKKEVDYLSVIAKPRLDNNENVYLFIRDENFPLQPDWKDRLKEINRIGAKIYLFASANLLTEDMAKTFKENNVYMVCLGLEDITVSYSKNKKLDESVKLLKKYGIYTYLSFIVNPLKIIGKDKGTDFYDRLIARFEELKPEMVCGNFLMPFRGTKIWDEYYAFVSPDDYKDYDSKSAFLVKNPVLRKKMEFFMYYYQAKYYRSSFYKENVRTFCKENVNEQDTLCERFMELDSKFIPMFEELWNKRA